MSDNPALGFALGYLAAGPATETATKGALMLTQALRGRHGPQIGVHDLLHLLQERDQHIAQQDELITRLRAINVEWQEYGEKLRAQKDRLQDWADSADLELKRYQNKD